MQPTVMLTRGTTGAPFVRIAVGFGHPCAVAADGTAYCWGDDDEGKLGDAPGELPEGATVPMVVRQAPGSL